MKAITKFAAALLSALLLCALLPTAAATYEGEAEQAVVGYYASWAAAQGCKPADIPAGLLTQINYAFAAIDPKTCTLTLANPRQDKENLAGLRELRRNDPNLRILICIGGWEYSAHFSDAASTSAKREAFAQSCLDFILDQDLDGIDLNWEYPVSGGSPGTAHRAADRENFTLLLQAVREKLDRQSAETGRTYTLTATGAADPGFLNKIEPDAVAGLVDFLFLMAYDFHGPWDSRTGFNAPLFSVSGQPSVQKSVQAYLDRGIPAEKIVLGMPLYGYLYRGAASQNSGFGGRFSSGESVPYDTVAKKYLTNSTYRQLFHAEAGVPYLYGNSTFLSYDDPASMAEKAALAKDLGLGGIGFWELSQDRDAVLVKSAKTAFTDHAFQDAAPGSWYDEAVQYVHEQGWMTETSTFSPESPISRGDLVTALYRMNGAPPAEGRPFSDIEQASACAPAAAWAFSSGVVNGYADGTFRPEDSITREQLVAVLWRCAAFCGDGLQERADLSQYADASTVSSYAQEPMAWAVGSGLLQGRTPTLLAPAGTVTHAEAATVLMRFAKTRKIPQH